MDFALINIDFSNTLSSAGDFLMGVAAVLAILYGQQRLKEYLVDEDVKSRVASIRSGNDEAREAALATLEELEGYHNLEGELSLMGRSSLTEIKGVASRLQTASASASSDIKTLTFLLRKVTEGLSDKYENGTPPTEGSEQKYYAMTTLSYVSHMQVVEYVCRRIVSHSLQVLIVPKVRSRSFMERLRAWWKFTGFTKAANKFYEAPLDLDLRPNTMLLYQFYFEALSYPHGNSYIYKGLIVRLLGHNTPVGLALLNQYKFYAPLVLKVTQQRQGSAVTEFLPDWLLSDVKQVTSAKETTISLFYSPKGAIRFHDPKTLINQLREYYIDSYSGETVAHMFDKYEVELSLLPNGDFEARFDKAGLPSWSWFARKSFNKWLYKG